MMICSRAIAVAMLAGLAGLSAVRAEAQSLGAFRWQLQAYCNVVTLNVTAQGAVFTLDGFDDQCGAGQRASVVGIAFLNPDGSVGIGLTTVLAPGGTAVHVDARISLSSLAGPWRDSAGNTGTFVLTPGPSTGGPPRPAAANGIPLGSVTAAQLAPGVIGGGQINPNEVQARVTGTCPIGQYPRGILANGTLLCEPTLALRVATNADDPANNVGAFSSIAIGSDGLPVISHADDSAGALRVTHCGNATCTTGNQSTNVDAPAGKTVGRDTSIAIGQDGLPIISHVDVSVGALRVTHCDNVACTTGTSTTIGPPGQISQTSIGTSVAIGSDGLPIISYRDNGTLGVTHCGNLACTSGNGSTTIANPPNIAGAASSIRIGLDNLPVISYLTAPGALRVTHCGNVTCTAGNVGTTVDGPLDGLGYKTSLAIGSDGLPVISYFDGSALRVTHCGNAACTSGNVSTTADDPPNGVGAQSSIAIGIDGLPVISHQDFTAQALRITHCGNVTCAAGNVSTTVDAPPGEQVGRLTSIAIGADGLPVVSHWGVTTRNLRVLKCATSTCQ